MEKIKRIGNYKIKHWLCWTRIYNIRRNINSRCWNSNNIKYKYYWGRWIKCLWKSFEEFYLDMLETYKEWLSIERINNNWNYCKENCKRITIQEQQQNKSDSVIISYNWKTQNRKQWAIELWLHDSTLRHRLNWWRSIEKAFTTKSLYYKK